METNCIELKTTLACVIRGKTLYYFFFIISFINIIRITTILDNWSKLFFQFIT